MHRWWQLATRNWWTKPGRTLAAILSVALGVGTVVSITGLYETVRRAVADEVVVNWVGSAHLSIEPPGGHWGEMRASLADEVAKLPNVAHVTARLKRRMFLVRFEGEDRLIESGWQMVDAMGINPETEMRFRKLPGLKGRMFDSSNRRVAVVEETTLSQWNASIGDELYLAPHRRAVPTPFTIVGSFESQRLAEFQKPAIYLPIADVRELCCQPGYASIVEVMLEDHSSAALAKSKAEVEALVKERGLRYKVESAEARQQLLDQCERVTRMIITLVAFVSMLTAFFIILTTMSMSLFERRSVLGMMRCVGVTRLQLAMLLLLELLPLGIIGTIVGVVAGMWLTDYVVCLPDTDITRVYFSAWGIRLAIMSGLATTLFSAAALIFQVCRVTPLVAVNPEARPAKLSVVFMAAAAGLVMIAAHQWTVIEADKLNWLSGFVSSLSSAALYLGYILLAPAMVVLIARPISRLVGAAMGINGRLAEDQFRSSPWRSAGICWMLMVGLSLIVYSAVRVEGVYAIWAFPAQLPSTFIWSPKYVSGDKLDLVSNTPGVASVTTTVDVDCKILSGVTDKFSPGRAVLESFLRKFTRPVFVAIDPERILTMIKISWNEGSREEALAKLKRGGHVVLPVQAARYHDLHLGDSVAVEINGKRAEFIVAGVVQSPAMDIAVTFFQASSYMEFAAASAILGTQADLRDKFGLDKLSMFMCDLDLPDSPMPEEFRSTEGSLEKVIDYTIRRPVAEAIIRWAPRLPNHVDVVEPLLPEYRAWLAGEGKLSGKGRKVLRRIGNALRYSAYRWAKRTPEERWYTFRERLVLLRIADVMERPDAIIGSLTRLKTAVEKSLRRVLTVLTWIPSITLIVAAIGIGNLMMVSVHARTRQIAILRSVGALKSQITRLILTEAITLGLLGSVMGLALGFHEAFNVNKIAEAISGIHLDFVVPVTTIVLCVALTIGVCLISGIPPARRAARNNIVEALHTT